MCVFVLLLMKFLLLHTALYYWNILFMNALLWENVIYYLYAWITHRIYLYKWLKKSTNKKLHNLNLLYIYLCSQTVEREEKLSVGLSWM